MNFGSYHKKMSASLVLLAVLALAACGQKNEPPVTQTTPASPPVVSTPPAVPATDTTTTTAGVPPTGNDCPSDAPIKGIDTKKRGKIYHDTKYPDYKKVKATICFKDVASAEKAGYKLPQAK